MHHFVIVESLDGTIKVFKDIIYDMVADKSNDFLRLISFFHIRRGLEVYRMVCRLPTQGYSRSAS